MRLSFCGTLDISAYSEKNRPLQIQEQSSYPLFETVNLNNSLLNSQQQTIVEHETGPALVIAGAGSGKTKVLTQRVIRLIEKGNDPESILLLTFTNKAAQEMMGRVEISQNRMAKRGKVIGGTFHSIANRYLRVYASKFASSTQFPYTSRFSILDQEDSKSLLKKTCQKMLASSKDSHFPSYSVIRTMFSLVVNRHCSLSQIIDDQYPYFAGYLEPLNDLYDSYHQNKIENNVMDFDDLLVNFLYLLTVEKRNPLRRIEYILVDEFQDTNRIQAEIVSKLSSRTRNIMVVGDDCQSIYSWRGAEIDNMMNFPNEYPNTKVYPLEINYRSSRPILELANDSISKNYQFDKKLVTQRTSGEIPLWKNFDSDIQEAKWVCNEIFSLIEKGISPKEIAVCYRAHSHSALLQVCLTKVGIAYRVRSGTTFFEQVHIKDVLSFLRILSNPLDTLAWGRLLNHIPGVGSKTALKIIQAIQENPQDFLTSSKINRFVPSKGKSFWECITSLYREMTPQTPISVMLAKFTHQFYTDIAQKQFENWSERQEDLSLLAGYGDQFQDLQSFLGEVSLVAYEEPVQEGDKKATEETIMLTTIHQAKGLEWGHVFVIGLADGMFPSFMTLEKNKHKMEEERRLFYVAVTRAKSHLTLTSPYRVSSWKGKQSLPISRFINEVDPSLLKREETEYSSYSRTPVKTIYRFE